MASKKKSDQEALASDAAALATQAAPEAAPADESASTEVAGRFVGQWNRLVSTTNWEKGRIICQWREALELAGAAVTDYSDEAWAQLVGGVTSQHVGRLRRVFQKFGATFDQYEGLYWSHFQASLDWDDSEMWLEGAILNNWSVSQMRGKRWETLGQVGEAPAEEAADAMEEGAALSNGESAAATARTTATPKAPRKSADDDADESESESHADEESSADSDDSPFDVESEEAPKKAKSRSRLAVDVDDLPADLAEAFEQFKLAIISQRRTGWREIQPSAVIECLDALKELALAPSDD
jgi:hypothetical protein